MVLFSILYGVMLQSLAGLQAFPLGRVRCGFVGRNKDDEPILERNKFCECKQVFREENHIPLCEFDEKQITNYKKWLLGMWRKRTIWSFILLNFLPFLYFWFIFFLLGNDYWLFRYFQRKYYGTCYPSISYWHNFFGLPLEFSDFIAFITH